jgi:hypothetical protein
MEMRVSPISPYRNALNTMSAQRICNRATIDVIDREDEGQNVSGESPVGGFVDKEQGVRCCFWDAGE